MDLTASIIVPTRHRAGYLDVALASILPQATAAGAEVLVVDDGPGAATRAAARRHGARYAVNAGARGLNGARNTGIDEARSALLVFVDDDVEAAPGWLAALLEADARAEHDVGVLTGPIRARFEDHRFRTCGREGPPISNQDFGPADRDVGHAWGANMAVRRSAVQRIGRFDEAHVGAGDEEGWERRLLAAGGRIRYVAAAAVDHRRAGDDARLRSLARAAYTRGATARRFDAGEGRARPLAAELRVLAGCLVHTVRFRCPNGIVMAATAAGRLRAAVAEGLRGGRAKDGDGAAPVGGSAAPVGGGAAPLGGGAAPAGDGASAGGEDFLSGRSGTVGGRRGMLRRAADALLDAEAAQRVRGLDRAARERPPRQRVLVLGVERPGRLMDAARAELGRSRHDVAVHLAPMGHGGKFEHLDALLAEHPADDHDWLLVLDDDVVLPSGFLDRFLLCAQDAGLALAQPAHRLHSHAAWPVTRRRPRGAVRESRFVEIGPVTAFGAATFGVLLPFPALAMGWGLDVHWGAVARAHGWRAGIVDATPVLHAGPAGAGYDREAAIAEARTFLAERPYVTRAEAAWSRRLA